MYRIVEIGKRIKGEELEKILTKAAEEVGLRTNSVDEDSVPIYKEQVYARTRIRLKGKVLPIAEISGIMKGEKRSWFVIGTRFATTPPYFGFGSEKQIGRYLSAVSKRLACQLQITCCPLVYGWQ